ncbi:MAG: ABC transporter ATP-binding protein [Actinomycetia bacterium]|nr:ABC transporter ATP-binding protein [Actinomycetes bacterium]
MIKVVDLKKNYSSFEALKSISFEVREGSVFGFIGRNGAGKTTTMNILTGLIGFNGGEIFIKGMDFKKNRRELIKHIGYLPETPAFYDYMNAYEYLDLIGNLTGYDKDDRSRRIDELLSTVKLKKNARRRIGGYSKGMKQRIALAAAIMDSPEILFLDEPSSALDPEGRLEMLELIDGLKDDRTTIFLSTHILNDAERVCDTICILDEGKILLTESLSKLYKEHTQPVLDIEFEADPENEADSLKMLHWVKDVKIRGKRASIEVNDIDIAKKEIFKELSRFDNSITGYQIKKMNLEDIFIGVVNKNADI